MDSKILVKFATRSRPEKFVPCINNLIEKCNQPDRLFILISVDTNDEKMWGQDHDFDGVLIVSGSSKNKIYAINRDIRFIKEDWDILINYSDDQEFVVQGFDDIIREGFATHFPDFDGVLHFNDQHHYKKVLMSMSIIGKKYYDRFGFVYHPQYVSLWCDNEAQEVAEMLGKYAYMGDDLILFHHHHPGWGETLKAKWDEQYEKTESYYGHDKKTFDERKANNFDLINVGGKWETKQ